MYVARSAQQVLSIAAAAALLAGCSNGATPQLAPGANSADGATGILHNGRVVSTSILDPKVALRKSDISKSHPLHGKIDARTKTFWISDAGDDAVQIFTFPSGTYLGSAPQPPEGFSEPQGMCSDKNGNVFVANTVNSTIDEYAANGTFAKAPSDPGEYPAGCAVDPSSGTLAVSNLISTSDNAGGISLYKNASGSPQQLIDPNMFEVVSIAYYGKTGKLYYSGSSNNSFHAIIDSYINGKFKVFIGNTTSIAHGNVAWASATKSLLIGGQDTSYLQVRANRKVIGKTKLSCKSGYCDVVQLTVQGKYIVAPDAESLDAAVYPYPAGGAPLVTVTGFGQPIGSAVSSVEN